MPPVFSTSAYRYPHEHLILAGTFFLVLAVIVLSASVTFCASALFVAVMVAMAYAANASHHQALLQDATPVDHLRAPAMMNLVNRCAWRLQPGPVQAFIAGGNILNAYTFGLSSPKLIVLYAALPQVMDADEMAFIIGHEMGHVRLGHTWLNTLLGGMAGIPSPYGAAFVLIVAFRGWNRACEFSADRAGLLACGSLDKAVSALIKLAAGPQALDPASFRRAIEQIESEDDSALGYLGEAFSTHPMLVRRIAELKRYAQTDAYQRLQARLAQNVPQG